MSPLVKCGHCGRLVFVRCRRTRWCLAWRRAHEKLDELSFTPRETKYSAAAGKYVVRPW